ncbi:MAG: TlpA family protein disulfide reductase [Chloroflexota bacterium]|nr:MAG: TlpA family protein disulfide reductase [Chloroflexota bacterium]
MTEMQIAQPEMATEAEAAPAQRGANIVTVFAALILTALALIFGLGLRHQQQTQPTEGLAPLFTLQTLDGQEIALESLRGKVVVINFWASWCGPCRDEAAELEAVWQQYKDKDVVFLGIAYTDTERNAQAYLKEFGITYPNGLDYKTKISAQYRITGVPETFIVDRTGHISEFVMVPLKRAQLSAMIERALAKGM